MSTADLASQSVSHSQHALHATLFVTGCWFDVSERLSREIHRGTISCRDCSTIVQSRRVDWRSLTCVLLHCHKCSDCNEIVSDKTISKGHEQIHSLFRPHRVALVYRRFVCCYINSDPFTDQYGFKYSIIQSRTLLNKCSQLRLFQLSAMI